MTDLRTCGECVWLVLTPKPQQGWEGSGLCHFHPPRYLAEHDCDDRAPMRGDTKQCAKFEERTND